MPGRCLREALPRSPAWTIPRSGVNWPWRRWRTTSLAIRSPRRSKNEKPHEVDHERVAAPPRDDVDVTPGNAAEIPPGNPQEDPRLGYKLADGTKVIIQGPRQGSAGSRLAALREATSLAEAELAEQGDNAQAA